MIAIILEEDQHSRAVLTSMLTGKQGLGYSSVLAATNFNEIEYLIRQNLGQVRLILSSNAVLDGLDIPLARLVIREPQLHLVPFILMLNGGRTISLNRIGERLSRVDNSIRKPFGISQLKESISIAHRRRSSLRSTLLVLGPTVAHPFAEAFYACRNLVHWQQVVPVASAEALDEKINELGFRIGGILLDPAYCDAAVNARIMKLKKTLEGGSTQIGALSQDPERIAGIRLHCDRFFDLPRASEPVEWEEIVLRMSRRVILNWEAREIVAQGRQALSSGDTKTAYRLAKKALILDHERWEFRELAGAVARRMGNKHDAIAHFWFAQKANPCSPFIYLNLIELLSGPSLEQIVESARAYCPRHPQVLAAFERVHQKAAESPHA